MFHKTNIRLKFDAHKAVWIAGGIFFVFIVLSVFIFLNDSTRELLTSPTALKEKISSYGPWGPLVIITYHVIQVIFAPIPGQAIDMANGYLFGPLKGSLYSLTGIFIGSIIAMSLARFFGRPLVKKLVSGPQLKKLNLDKGHRKLMIFFVLFLIPGLPDDFLCFALGLTTIPLWRGMLAAILGRSPSIVASVILGSTGRGLSPAQFIIVAALIGAVLLLLLQYLPRSERIKNIKNKVVRMLK